LLSRTCVAIPLLQDWHLHHLVFPKESRNLVMELGLSDQDRTDLLDMATVDLIAGVGVNARKASFKFWRFC